MPTSLRVLPWDQTSTSMLLIPHRSMSGTAALISHQMRVRSGREEGIASTYILATTGHPG
jgi:hypothetical protein